MRHWPQIPGEGAPAGGRFGGAASAAAAVRGAKPQTATAAARMRERIIESHSVSLRSCYGCCVGIVGSLVAIVGEALDALASPASCEPAPIVASLRISAYRFDRLVGHGMQSAGRCVTGMP